MKLHWQILIALALAVVAGLASGTEGSLLGVRLYAAYDFVGTLFLNALKMIIVPLIASSIITGIAGIGGGRGLGRLGGKTVLFYLTTSLLSVLVGLIVVNAFKPGIIDGQPARDVLGLSAENAARAAEQVAGKGAGDIADVFLGMIPANVIAAAANGQMLGLIFFSILFGFFIARINEDYAEVQYSFWQGLFEVMMKITDLVMRFAPLGVFALVAKVVAGMGGENLAELAGSLGIFAFSVVLALAVHAFVTLPLLLRLVARVNPLRHYRAMAPALLTAFSTASSSATLPLTMECVEKNAGVSNRTSSFVLPLGATVNMDGTALYECVAAMFIAQAYGLELGFAEQLTVVLVALLTSIGVAGIPAASLVAIAIILAAIGLPAEGIGLILAVDRILDMLRTSLNVFSDSCGAVIIGWLEGEKQILVAPA
ncbi:MAG: dicarboxylate/amino acid:cation symporter [Gammaproteobacteria bacterium]|nr:dicarboxylate/amino acid:cation symporter [Gammaproteobacteria bacterium]NIR96977.1 dicarboxylate/amino acid:cation symporter [Gammaproteobacteria bacterium]NIT62679.1 dicarboxylate/amino acid:cation symporter [Gammaproteobacteria bacterium]NIV19639.1 cation:dicarboxylase symporter family transporter [Gammaproteobacteria bacterium]NIX10859.1 cation:dicarboxylase symporter family transporter [Gammaproteobacteria bacterium]